MIYIEVDDNGSISYQHDFPFDSIVGLGKTEEELKEKGILVESVPEPIEIESKQPILKWNGIELYYEYVDIPKTEEQIIQEKIKELQQSIIELSMLMAP